jgi:hypothetical protein
MKGVTYDKRTYPLAWPVGWPRSKMRAPARYQVDAARARKQLVEELRKMGAKSVIISSNAALGVNGMPKATDRPSDSGVAVYWTDSKNVERVIACDRWHLVQDNIRACGLAIEALRQLDRTGASEIIERAFAGFKALPASTSGGHSIPSQNAKRPWRDVLCVREDKPSHTALKIWYRHASMETHPDRGGTVEAFNEVTRAYEEGCAELGYTP